MRQLNTPAKDLYCRLAMLDDSGNLQVALDILNICKFFQMGGLLVPDDHIWVQQRGKSLN